MISKWMLAAAPLFAAFPSTLQAQAVTPDQMMRHIKVLASDEYEGRKPGTPGENKTLYYIASQLAALGIEPAGTNGWYQPVEIVERIPVSHQVQWTRGTEDLGLNSGDFVLIGDGASESLADAPVYFVGHGLVMPEQGIDQLAGVDLQGAVAFFLTATPENIENAPRYEERVAVLMSRGAKAVIGVLDRDSQWPSPSAARYSRPFSLAINKVPAIGGIAPYAVLSRIAGSDAPLTPEANPKDFRPLRLNALASLNVRTETRPFTSHNVIGRLRGSGKTGESILYLGHWDHYGLCRPIGAPDRICNGAVDNASGIAMMIEIARHMASGKRPARDMLFMGTTAEEMGLLGAEYFGANPVVPADKIAAAINIDTVAISPKGEPVAILGRGMTGLDPLVDEAARELGRTIDTDDEANAFVQRQDGWKLTQAGIPTVMIGGSFSNMKTLRAFLGGIYHKPEDDLNRPIELGGAVEDADLMIVLGRKLADPQKYQRPMR